MAYPPDHGGRYSPAALDAAGRESSCEYAALTED